MKSKKTQQERNAEVNVSLIGQKQLSKNDERKKYKNEINNMSQIQSVNDLWKWFKKDPVNRWLLIFFLITFCLVLVWVIIFFASGGSKGFIAAGVVGCFSALVGFYHFRLLMGLKEKVEKLSNLNSDLKRENVIVNREVNKLQEAEMQLKTTENALHQSLTKQKETLHNLTKLTQNLSTIGSKNNNDAINKLQNMSKATVSKWKEQLLSHERQFLTKLFEKFEFKNDDGLQEDEFNKFLEIMPVKYQIRFRKMGIFKQLAGNDKKIDFDEFKIILDKMANQEINDENF